MAAADVEGMPSAWEGFGLVAVEAMLARTPLVAGDSPGLREWVTDGETGFLAPPDDLPRSPLASANSLSPEPPRDS